MHFKGVRGNMVDRGHHQPKMEFKLIRPRWSFQCEPFFLKPLGSGFTARSLKYAINVVVCRKLKLWFIWKNTIKHFVLKELNRHNFRRNIIQRNHVSSESAFVSFEPSRSGIFRKIIKNWSYEEWFTLGSPWIRFF